MGKIFGTYNPATRETIWPTGQRLSDAERYLGTSTVPVQPVQPTPMASPTPSPSHRCTYTLEVREYHHSLTTYNLSLETLAQLVLTVGRQFAEEMASLGVEERHSLYLEIRPESQYLSDELAESIGLEGPTLPQDRF